MRIIDVNFLDDQQFICMIEDKRKEFMDCKLDKQQWEQVFIRIRKLVSDFSPETRDCVFTEYSVNISKLSAKFLEIIPDKIFRKIDLSKCSKKELFLFFHPRTTKTLNKLGNIAKIRGDNFHMTSWDSEGCTNVVQHKSLFNISVKKKEEYNKRRLALFTKEQYMEVKAKLHKDIVKLGDEIFAKKRNKRRQRHKKHTNTIL